MEKSHLYHCHNDWAVKNPKTLVFELKTFRTKTSPGINVHESCSENVGADITKSPRQVTMSKYREVIATSSINISPPGKVNSQKSQNTSMSSSSSTEDDIDVPFVKIHGNPIEFEALLDDIKIESCDNDPEDSRQNGSDTFLNRTSENHSDDILKALYSCKECYVPLSRTQISGKASENLRQGSEIVNMLEGIHATVQRRNYYNQYEAVSPDEIWSDECTIKSEPNVLMEASAECFETLNASSLVLCETTSIKEKSSNNQSINPGHNTVISSKICDKYFTSRRAMQRHFRQRHLIALEDVVYCVCGKPMRGRTEKEKHFYQCCGQVIANVDVVNASSETFTSCRPLEKKYKCAKCGENFWLETCLKDHQPLCQTEKIGEIEKRTLTMEGQDQYRRLPRNSARYVCTECNSGFNTSKALSQHIQKYDNSESHPCPICKTVFNGRRLLKGHIQSTHESNRKHLYDFFCEICNQGFTKNLYKRIHVMHCHTVQVTKDIDVTVFNGSRFVPQTDKPARQNKAPLVLQVDNSAALDNKCKVCNLVFVSRKRFIDHMIYYKKDEIIYCGICAKDFEGQYMAHHHNKKFHYAKDMQKAYTHRCTICQDGFTYKTHLQAHMSHVHDCRLDNTIFVDGKNQTESRPRNCITITVQNNGRKKHTCTVCEMRFKTAAILATHELKYSNDGEFVCNQCPRKCRTAVMLLDHISLNHSDSVVRDGVKCSRCNENLLTRTAWVSHVKHFHNSDGNEPSEFCFENNVSSSKEFGNVEIELIPTNESISSGLAHINFGNSIHHTDRRATGLNLSEIRSMKVRSGQSTSRPCIVVKGDNAAIEKISENCNTCGLACSGSSELTKHIALYSNNGDYNCTICDRRFTWQRYYENHKVKHFRHEPSNSHFCPICGEGFGTITEMRMHKAHLHQGGCDIDEINCLSSAKNFIENRVIELKVDEMDIKPRLQAEIFEVEPSLVYECPICKVKYLTVEELDEHLMSSHGPKNSDRNDEPRDWSNSVHDPVKCITCKAVFVNEKILKIHENNFHSSGPVAGESPTEHQYSAVGNRFYILAGIEILPEAAEIIETNFDRCNKRLKLTNCIYRYDPSYRCDICNIILASKDLLHTHQRETHTVLSNAPIDNTNANEQRSRDRITVKKTAPYSLHEPLTMEVKCFSPASDSASQQYIENPYPTVELSKKIGLPVFTKSILKHIQTKSNTQVKHYRCKICDLIFVNRNLLRVHEVNSNCLKEPNKQTDTECLDEENISVPEGFYTLENSSPLAPEKVNDTTTQLLSKQNQLSCDIESVKMSMSTNELNTPIAKTPNNNKLKTSVSSNARSLTPPRMRLIKLPPGNYRIGKLKVRPFGKIVQNVIKKTGCKRNDESLKNLAPAAKRVKKVFDPAVYRELCRQHNLVPPFEVHKEKSSIKAMREI